VTQLLDIFAFVSVLFRGLTLAFEALTLGGVIFFLVVSESRTAFRLTTWAAILLAASQACSVLLNAAVLEGTTGMDWSEVAGAGFCIAGVLVIAGAAAVLLRTLWWPLGPIGGCLVLCGSLMNSHSFARVEDRWMAMALTLAHHLAAAAWVGGMPYLLLALRHAGKSLEATRIVSRFSSLAVVSVLVLVGAGVGMSLLFVGTPAALVGTTYGIMLAAKVALTGVLLSLGALNNRIVRAARAGTLPELLPLRRFAEAEVGIGFTILLAAASLTSTPPAIDVTSDMAHGPEIVHRMAPRLPSMQTPSLSELSPPSALKVDANSTQPGSYVPGQLVHPNTPADIAWSEYNHHWAGLVVLSMGCLALLSRRFAWARLWPLMFFGLAAFLFFRADSENWPLGPRGFWESFQVAEVAQHRVFVLLIIAFAVFEWRVQIGRLRADRAGLVFPLVCALGGALLLTHSHSLGNVKDEYFAEMSHLPLAILAVVAGWSRWLEIRLPKPRIPALSWVWASCFTLIGVILLSYRES